MASNELRENRSLAAFIAKGVEHRLIADLADAEAYAARIAIATYGEVEATAQLPFRAEAIDDRWRIVGSKPMNLAIMSGPLTIIVSGDGTIQEIMFTIAPAGWEDRL
ncbi:MAG: NTF2 fold immunity protein [Janthinobacterium lividum]